MRYAILLLFHLYYSILCTAQPLQGTINGHSNSMIYLNRYDVTQYGYVVYDSVRTDYNGYFSVPQPLIAGLYGLGAANSNNASLMYVWMGSGHPIRFVTQKENPNRAVIWYEDSANSSAHRVSDEVSELNKKFSICSQLLDMYPDTSGAFYNSIKKEYLAVQNEMLQYQKKTASKYRGLVTERIVRQFYFSLPGKQYGEAQRNAFWKEHFLDSVNFSDPLLQRSHLLKEKIDQFLALYGFPGKFNNAKDASVAVKPAIRILIQQCLNSSYTVRDMALQLSAVEFVSGYLFQKFTYLTMDDMIDEVVNQVPDYLLTQNTCTDESRKNESEGFKRIVVYKKLFNGRQAPSFTFSNGNATQSLEDIRAQNTLVVFWASWCTHCEEMLPHIQQLYNGTSRTDIEIVAISVDTSAAAYNKMVAEKEYRWPQRFTGRGWEDEVTRNYGVMGTPTFFMLDADKKIVGKPKSTDEIKDMMQ